jgi:EmrB/QacA subfamily drug resistance transporter
VGASESSATDKRAVLLVTCAAAFLFPFMGSSVNVALPAIGVGLDMKAVDLPWVATAFLLTSSLLLVPFGRLGDMRGRKRVLVTGVGIYAVGSVIAGLAQNGSMLIVARAVQGAGGAMLAATSVAILVSVHGPAERGRVLGINAAALYTGLSVGPALGGILTQSFGWRAVFLVNVPLGLTLFLAAYYKLPRQQPQSPEARFDWAGFAAYAVFLVGGVYGMTRIPDVEGFAGIGIGIVGFLALLKIEGATKEPLMDIALFRSNLAFAMSNLAAFLNYSAFFAATFLLSLYLQIVTGLSPRAAGLVLVAMPVIQALISPVAGRLSDQREPRVLTSAGMALSAASLFLMSRFDVDTPIAQVALALALLGLGVGLFSSPNTNAVMTSVQPSRYGLASATLSTTRQVGMVLSMGIATLFIASSVGATSVEATPPDLFVDAMRSTFLLCTVACLIGIVASIFRGTVHHTMEDGGSDAAM